LIVFILHLLCLQLATQFAVIIVVPCIWIAHRRTFNFLFVVFRFCSPRAVITETLIFKWNFKELNHIWSNCLRFGGSLCHYCLKVLTDFIYRSITLQILYSSAITNYLVPKKLNYLVLNLPLSSFFLLIAPLTYAIELVV
jgi:hypothetical protein